MMLTPDGAERKHWCRRAPRQQQRVLGTELKELGVFAHNSGLLELYSASSKAPAYR
jgi:hypothetical protein